VLQDVRYALRTFVRTPGFAATAALTLAIGIGANTAIFTVVYALLLKPLPFDSPDRLIYLHDTFPAVSVASVSYPKFLALRDGNRTLTSLAAFVNGTLTLTGRGEPQQVTTARVTGRFFDVLGVKPLVGRVITPDDDLPDAVQVVVLSYGLWQRLLAGAPDVIGRTIVSDGRARTIVGVMPPDFAYPPREAWVPLALPPTTPGGNNFLRLIGRMQAGVTLEQASTDLRSVTAGFNRQAGLQRDVRVYLLHEFLSQGNRQMVLVLQGAVLLVLLVACANVANMLLARSVSRRREFAVRLAIGAAPGRLLRQLLTESVLLASFGGALGMLLAAWLVRMFLALAPVGFGAVQSIGIDRNVLAVTACVAMLTGVVFGVAPARRGFQVDANDGLRDAPGRGASAGARGASRLLVVAEVGLAMVLVIGAGLLVKSLLRLQSQEAGFRAGGLMTFQLTLPSTQYDTDRTRRTMAEIVASAAGIPGVRAAGAINFLPLAQFGFNGPFTIPGRPPLPQADRAPVVEYRMVTPGYFAAMSIPLRRGAVFTDRDNEQERPIVIINETMARQFWPDSDPIGERLQLGMEPSAIVREIVGVVGDVRSQALNRPPVPEAFVPFAQVPIGSVTVAVRADGDLASLLPSMRVRIAAIDASLPIVRTQTMESVVESSAGSMRLSSTLTTVFALLAALLASVGIYSLVSCSVASRTREIGIRVALGAKPVSVLRLIIGEGLRLAAAGLVIGVIGTFALAGTLKSMLFEVSPVDPLVLFATAVAVLILTGIASFVPAWRVMRVNPTVALRTE